MTIQRPLYLLLMMLTLGVLQAGVVLSQDVILDYDARTELGPMDPDGCITVDHSFTRGGTQLAVIPNDPYWFNRTGTYDPDDSIGYGNYIGSSTMYTLVNTLTLDFEGEAVIDQVILGYFVHGGNISGAVPRIEILLYNDGALIDTNQRYDGVNKGQLSRTVNYSDLTIDRVIIKHTHRASYSGSFINDIYLGGSFDCQEVPEPPTLYKPVLQYDIKTAPNRLELLAGYNTPLDYTTVPAPELTTFTVANGSGVSMHNPISGTVVSVRGLTTGDCSGFGLDGGRYYFPSPLLDVVTTEALRVALNLQCSFLYEDPFLVASMNPNTIQLGDGIGNDLYYVELLGEDGNTYTSIVKNADSYLEEGLNIPGGCQMGTVPPASSLSFNLDFGGGSIASYELEEGFGFIRGTDSAGASLDIVEGFTLEPNETPCNQPSGYEVCLGDGGLQDQSAWNITSGQFINGSVMLQPGGSMSTTVTLNPAQQPGLTVSARAVGGEAPIIIQLGDGSGSGLLGVNWQEVAISPGAYTGSNVQVDNNGTVPVNVRYVCVQNTLDPQGTPIPPPTAPPPGEEQPPPGSPVSDQVGQEDIRICTFLNNSFSDSNEHWTIGAGVEVPVGYGSLLVPSSGTFEQDIDIRAGDYTLTVLGSIWSYNTYSPDDSNTTGDITIEYDIGGGYNAVQQYGYDDYASSANKVIYEANLNFASDYDGPFSFRTTLTSPPTGVRGLEVLAVCLASDTTIASGGGSVVGGYDGVFNEVCEVVPLPNDGGSIGAWLGWHWQKLNNFFQCELMIFLKELYRAIVSFFEFIGWIFRYWIELINGFFQWLGSSVVPWLEGHFANMASGRTTLITNDGEQCNNLFCLLEGIGGVITELFPVGDLLDFIEDFFGPVMDLLINMVGDLWGLAVQFINSLMGMLQAVVDLILNGWRLLFALLTAWQDATPVSIEGVPNCNIDPKGSGLCIFMWMLENTIFSGVGYNLLNMVIGYTWIVVIIWVIKKFKAVTVDVSRTF
jgi:hypothetical protein